MISFNIQNGNFTDYGETYLINAKPWFEKDEFAVYGNGQFYTQINNQLWIIASSHLNYNNYYQVGSFLHRFDVNTFEYFDKQYELDYDVTRSGCLTCYTDDNDNIYLIVTGGITFDEIECQIFESN